MIFLLAGCSGEAAETAEPVEAAAKNVQTGTEEQPVTFEQNGQKFEVYTYFSAYEDYIQQAKEQPDKLAEVYAATVEKQYNNNSQSAGDGVGYLAYWMIAPSEELLALQGAVASLEEREHELIQSIEEALRESAEMLTGGEKTVHLFPADPVLSRELSAMNHATGVVFNEHSLVIFVTPSVKAKHLKHTVAHEYAHTVDSEDALESEDTVLDAVLKEGKADSFANLLYPKIETPWTQPFTETNKEIAWKAFEANKEAANSAAVQEILYGNPREEIPIWTGYTIGYTVMQAFLEHHPDMPVEEWMALDAEEILAGSGLGN